MLRSAKGFMALGLVAVASFAGVMIVMPYLGQERTAPAKLQDIVIVQDFNDNIPLPSKKRGWVFSHLTATIGVGDGRTGMAPVHLVDSNTAKYGVADYRLTELDPTKKLGISINVKKNSAPHNILLLRLQYPNGQIKNCSFDTQTGKKSVGSRQNAGVTAGVKDFGNHWLFSCVVAPSGGKMRKALLRLFPGAGSTERALSAKATGKVVIMQILLEH